MSADAPPDPPREADLLTLVAGIGPMPAGLACDYLRGVAARLEHFGVHGDVSPRTLIAGPLVPLAKPKPDGTPRYRPAADATVRLADAGEPGPTFAAPERVAGGPPSVAADVYGFGASLYYLLTGASGGFTTPLTQLRPDAPTALAEAVHAMLSADPARRPGWGEVIAALGGVPEQPADVVPSVSSIGVPVLTDPPPADALAAVIDDALAANVGPWTPAEPPPVPVLTQATEAEEAHPLGRVESLESLEGDAPLTPEEAFVPREYVPGQSGEEDYAAVPPVLDDAHPDELPADGPLKPRGEVKKSQVWLWVGLGVGLQLLAVLLWVVYLFNPFAGGQTTTPTSAKKAGK